MPSRRSLLQGAGASVAAIALVPAAAPAAETMAEAMRGFTGDAPVRPGRVMLEVPPLVENGNTVPLLVRVESPMTATDHVQAIAVFNERNPQPHVITARLGPRAGRAELATRIRLATSQNLVAIARMSDGSFWSARAGVVVTLAACVES